MTPARATRWSGWPPAPTCCCARRRSARTSRTCPNLHLTGAQAGEHAKRAGVDRLIVTHVPPWGSREVAVAEAATTFSGPVEAAQPDAVYQI